MLSVTLFSLLQNGSAGLHGHEALLVLTAWDSYCKEGKETCRALKSKCRI